MREIKEICTSAAQAMVTIVESHLDIKNYGDFGYKGLKNDGWVR